MTVAAAIRITSPDESRAIEHAVEFARKEGTRCFVISVVDELPYGTVGDDDHAVVQRNLALISEAQAAAVMQQGDDIARTLLDVARGFGVRMLFLRTGSVAEELLRLNPPFDVVVVGSE